MRSRHGKCMNSYLFSNKKPIQQKPATTLTFNTFKLLQFLIKWGCKKEHLWKIYHFTLKPSVSIIPNWKYLLEETYQIEINNSKQANIFHRYWFLLISRCQLIRLVTPFLEGSAGLSVFWDSQKNCKKKNNGNSFTFLLTRYRPTNQIILMGIFQLSLIGHLILKGELFLQCYYSPTFQQSFPTEAKVNTKQV